MGSNWRRMRASRRREQPWEVAQRRIDKLKEFFESQGYYVSVNRAYNSGVDMLVLTSREEGVIKVLEVTNYAERDSLGTLEYIPDYKFDRYIENLNAWDGVSRLGWKLEKIIVVSYPTNLTPQQMKKASANNITITILGYQD